MAIPGERNGTDGLLSHERNWSELPEDILHLLSKKLPDISDFIRFRAVCKSWQLSALVTDPPPQLPWLLEHHYPNNSKNAIIRFYCLSSCKVHTITCPSYHHAWLNVPGCRFLLASNLGESKRYLLNPLTLDQICVPFFLGGGGCADYIGPGPIEGCDIVVMSGINSIDNLNTPPTMMAFWRPTADDWVYVEGVGRSANAFYMGQYFSNKRRTGITSVIDIATKKLAYQIAPPEDTNPLLRGRTIMVVSGEKILRLFRYYEDEQCHFDIYYLYYGGGEVNPSWVKITNIGDQMLFVQNYSGLSLCASNLAGFKENCIYFLKGLQYLCRYNIGDGTTEMLPCPFDSIRAWFVPSLVKLSDIK